MTTLDERVVATQPSSGTESGRGSRTRVLLLVLLLVPLVVVGVVWRRAAWAAGDRAAIRVLTDSEALSCNGASVENGESIRSDNAELVIPMAAIEPGMRCEYTFWVTNDGDEPVQLRRVLFPVLGPAAGPAVEAIALNGIRPNAEQEVAGFASEAVDAVFEIASELVPGSAMELRLLIVHRPDGCTVGGGSISFPDAPKLTLRSRGVTGERSAESLGFGFVGHPTLNCDEP